MGAGRPKKKLDYDMVEKLAGIMCTEEEIANFFDCSVRTLQRDANFVAVYKKGQDTGRISLRRMQWKLAEKNVAMAIFLGKNYLGQKDAIEQTHAVENGILDELVGALKDAKDNR